jgi:hypothetical protein
LKVPFFVNNVDNDKEQNKPTIMLACFALSDVP